MVTVCRRYHELKQNLRRLREAAISELGGPMDVVLVWARPELGRLWLIEELQQERLITHVIGRPPLEGEVDGVATSWPESHSIRLGLEFVAANYPDHYAVVMACDIWPQDGTLGFVHGHMAEHEAVLFHWENGIAHQDVWHTNFFAVGMDQRYWPPLSSPDHMDTLERQWGMALAKAGLPAIFRWHNSGGRRFLHRHQSESLPQIAVVPRRGRGGLSLLVIGHRSWWLRAWDFIKRYLPWH